jgi:hypothetical protein
VRPQPPRHHDMGAREEQTGPRATRSTTGLGAHRDALAHCRHWHTTVRPALLAMLTGQPQQLTLVPTPRSLLR